VWDYYRSVGGTSLAETKSISAILFLEAKLTSTVEIGSMTMTEETKHDMEEEDFEILLLSE